jgi:hypothetical protein
MLTIINRSGRKHFLFFIMVSAGLLLRHTTIVLIEFPLPPVEGKHMVPLLTFFFDSRFRPTLSVIILNWWNYGPFVSSAVY